MVTGQNGETGWIRRELIHLHPWNNPTDEQLTAMKRSAKLLTQSAKQIDDELLREALASAQAALATVEQTRKSHELAAWVRCQVAYLQTALGGACAGEGNAIKK